MRILCPMCGFGREMDESKVPERAQMATCPKCSHKFRFRVVDDLEPAPGQSPSSQPLNAPSPQPSSPMPSGQDLSAGQSDPMAGQRAAAAEAWKRLQTPPPAAAPSAASAQATAQAEAATPAAEGPRSTGSPVPFEDLPLHGFFPGLWNTIRQVLTKPSDFFSTMPVTGGMGRPLVFFLLVSEFMVLCQFVWGIFGIGVMAQYLQSPELMDMGMGLGGFALVLLLVVGPLVFILNIMLMTALTHVLLKLLRSGGSGPEATFRVLCYASAPLLLCFIPVLGPHAGELWSLGLAVIGLHRAHRTSVSASLFAVMVPLLMLLAAVLGLMQGMLKAG